MATGKVKAWRVFYLVFDHCAEVVIPEKDAELSLLHGGRELTQAVVRQLGGRAAQKLLRHDTYRKETVNKKGLD